MIMLPSYHAARYLDPTQGVVMLLAQLEKLSQLFLLQTKCQISLRRWMDCMYIVFM